MQKTTQIVLTKLSVKTGEDQAIKVSYKKVFGYFIVFIFAFYLASFSGRVFGVPVSYFSLYIPTLYFIFKNIVSGVFFVPPVVLKMAALMTLYVSYSLIVTTDVISTLVYYLMWLANIFVVLFILKVKDINSFLFGFMIFVVLSVFVGLLLYFIFGYQAQPYQYIDRNAWSFVLFVVIVVSLYYKKNFFVFILLVSALLTLSRTLYVMVIFFSVFILYKNITLKVVTYLIAFSSIALSLIDFNSIIIERIDNSIELGSLIIDSFNKPLDLSIAQELNDKQRFVLFFANLDVLLNYFPFGTGMGLKNYLNHIDPYYYDYLAHGNPHRAHNFYISYLSEMGVVVFSLLIVILFKPLFFPVNYIIKAGYASLLIGITFNEYVTSPFFWLLFALVYRFKEAEF